MAFIFSLAVTYVLLTAFGMSVLWQYRRASPIFWFQGALALMAFGSLPFVSAHFESDVVYIIIMYLAHASFIAGTFVTAGMLKLEASLKRFSQQPNISPTDSEIVVCAIVLTVSAVVTIIYYYLVGYNILLMFARGDIIGNYSDLRLETYSGDEYFAPGYVNQFKNVLLPLSAAMIGLRLWERRRMDLFVPYVVVVVPGVIMALAGTGQRAYLVYTLAALSFGYFLHNSGRATKVNWKPIILAAIPLMAIFIGLTASYSGGQNLGEAVARTLARFTTIQQEGGLFAFQYVYKLPITWFGEWWQNLKGVVPGVEGSRIAHDVHAVLYGSDRGTVPLTSIGSAYYNGGFIGVFIFFLVLGIGYTIIYRRYLDGERNYIRSYSYGLVFFYLSINVIDAPTILLENGVLTALLFILLLRVVRASGRPRISAAARNSAVVGS